MGKGGQGVSLSASRCEVSRVVASFPFLSGPAGVMRSGALQTVLCRDETADALLPRPRISAPAAAIVPFAAGRFPVGSRGDLNMHSTTSYETKPETAAFPPPTHNKQDAGCVQGPPGACFRQGFQGAPPPRSRGLQAGACRPILWRPCPWCYSPGLNRQRAFSVGGNSADFRWIFG